MEWDEPAGCTTQRGWLGFAPSEHPDYGNREWDAYGFSDTFADEAPLACGNYLHYPDHDGEAKYHAAAYMIRVGPGGHSTHRLDIPAPWFMTREEAKRTIAARVARAVPGVQVPLV